MAHVSVAPSKRSRRSQRKPSLYQPSKRTIAERSETVERAKEFVLMPLEGMDRPPRVYDRPYPGAEQLNGDARAMVTSMFDKYPTALSNDQLSPAQSAVNLAYREWSQARPDLAVKGSPTAAAFSLATAFFMAAIASAEQG